jgi:PAS domain S-box-containing protein
MNHLFQWMTVAGDGDALAGAGHELLWAGVTLALSAVVAAGYGVIAVNWYFQARLARCGEARAALARLRGICLTCAACGLAFVIFDMPWIAWRGYDLALLVLAVRTWTFVRQMRGWSLVDERLAQIEEIERSATRYREIAELLPHMVWTSAGDGSVDYSNLRWRQYTGCDRTWLDAVHPEERDDVCTRWDAAVAQLEPLSLETRLAGTGGYRTFLVTATPVVQGEAVKWLGACADIEDQRLLAAEKERQARQRTFFLNALSHDLRAPLHNVLLNAHLLKMSFGELDAGAESVEMIVENAVAAGDMVTRLLDFAKVGAQDQNEIETVSVAAALHLVARRFQPLAEQKGLSIHVSGAADAPILTDRQKLDRIISNLVENAIKYTQHGGVTLELSVRGGEAIVRVADTGIGIPPENAPYLFDEFYQVSNYERDRSKGFGMGLAICKSLARHIAGDIRLAHTGPEGSCFELVVRSVGAHRGGRPGGTPRDLADPAPAGICRV